MKNSLFGLAVLAFSLLALAFSWLSRPDRIGYAETSVLLTEFVEASKARKQFEEAQKEWDRNLNLLNDSLVAAMNTMKASYEDAPASEKQRMRENLERRNDDLQRYTNAVKRMSEEKEQELMEPVVRKMNGFLDQWGRENGYAMILGTLSGGNILQADQKLNVTARVLKDMNAHYADLPKRNDGSGKSADKPKTPASKEKAVK